MAEKVKGIMKRLGRAFFYVLGIWIVTLAVLISPGILYLFTDLFSEIFHGCACPARSIVWGSNPVSFLAHHCCPPTSDRILPTVFLYFSWLFFFLIGVWGICYARTGNSVFPPFSPLFGNILYYFHLALFLSVFITPDSFTGKYNIQDLPFLFIVPIIIGLLGYGLRCILTRSSPLRFRKLNIALLVLALVVPFVFIIFVLSRSVEKTPIPENCQFSGATLECYPRGVLSKKTGANVRSPAQPLRD
ncbi:MAG: hypothetical protein FWF24_01405 [Alphaproteobacteria bacterium]|nr:hypothetical protein [Alphaproteobacteria bacterium]